MKKVWAIVLAPLLLALAQNPGPTLSMVSPNSVAAGSAEITIILTGTGFTASSLAIADQSTDLATNFVNSTTLTAVVPATLLQSSRLIAINVFNVETKVLSGAAYITVTSSSPPTVTTIAPLAVAAGTTSTLTISGSSLLGGAVSLEGGNGDAGIDFTVTSQSTASRLVLSISVSANALGGNRNLVVTTPAGRSQPKVFAVFREYWQPVTRPNLVALDGIRLPDGRVFFISARLGQLYDSNTDSWIEGETMLTPRTYYSSSILPDGRILVAGGDDFNTGTRLNTAEIFDPVTLKWSPSGPFTMRVSRSENGAGAFQMILLPNGKVLAVGGTNTGDPPELYDPTTGRWVFAAAPPFSRFSSYLNLLSSGLLLVTQGALYDCFSNTWSAVPVSVSGTTFLLPDGRLFAGGTRCVNCSGPSSSQSTESFASIVDPNTGQASKLPFGAGNKILLADDHVLAVDITRSGSGAYQYQSRLFDPVANTWVATSNAPQDSTMVVLRNGDVLSGYALFKYERTHPRPVVSEITTLYTDAGVQSLSIRGSGFLTNSQVRLGTHDLHSIYLGSNKLIAFVPASLLGETATSEFTVNNPSPGGGSSSPQGVGANTAPAITGLTPESGTAGTTIDATIRGFNLKATTSVTLSGSGAVATILSGGDDTALPVRIAIASDAPAGTRNVTIVTTGGVATAANAFTVVAAPSRYPTTPPQVIPEVEEGTIRVGYAILTPDAGSPIPNATVTFGMVRNGSVSAQASVLPNPMTTDASFFIDVVPDIQRDLGVAIANGASATNTITLTLADLDGVAVGNSRQISIPAGAQVARFVSELFGRDTINAGLRGRLRVTGTAPFAILGLRFSGTEFSTLPPALASVVGGSNSILFPQFAISGGWASQIALLNTSSSTATGRIDIFDIAGAPMSVTLNGQRRSTFSYSIPAGGAAVFAPVDRNGQSPF